MWRAIFSWSQRPCKKHGLLVYGNRPFWNCGKLLYSYPETMKNQMALLLGRAVFCRVFWWGTRFPFSFTQNATDGKWQQLGRLCFNVIFQNVTVCSFCLKKNVVFFPWGVKCLFYFSWIVKGPFYFPWNVISQPLKKANPSSHFTHSRPSFCHRDEVYHILILAMSHYTVPQCSYCALGEFVVEKPIEELSVGVRVLKFQKLLIQAKYFNKIKCLLCSSL